MHINPIQMKINSRNCIFQYFFETVYNKKNPTRKNRNFLATDFTD